MEHFSITQLNMFLRCPAQYAFRYLDGLILPPTSALTKGRCVHKGAEYNYRQKFTSFTDVSIEEITDVVAGQFDSEAKGTYWDKNEDKGKIKDETLKLAVLYHKEVAPKVQPIFVEHEFKIALDGECKVPLLGYIDVIDEGFTVRDIKTASKAPAENEAARSLQLTAYAMAYRELSGTTEKGVALDCLVQNKQPKAVTVTAQKTEADIDRLKKIVRGVLKAIKAENFYPNPSNFMCSAKNCGYWTACHQKYGGKCA